MNVIYTIPYKPNRLMRLIARTCLVLIGIGSVIFTTICFLQALERSNPHGHPNSTHRRSLDPQGSARH
jgi:hypothetical protein